MFNHDSDKVKNAAGKHANQEVERREETELYTHDFNNAWFLINTHEFNKVSFEGVVQDSRGSRSGTTTISGLHEEEEEEIQAGDEEEEEK